MCNQEKLDLIAQTVVQASELTLGILLDRVILFGSYARGDYDSESDIDFCILADIPREEAVKWRRDINKRISGIDLDYDILVSLHVISSSMFYNHIDVLPFYKNVLQDGVEVNG